MHNKDDENYKRGYEWWLMSEAKKVSLFVCLFDDMHAGCNVPDKRLLPGQNAILFRKIAWHLLYTLQHACRHDNT